MERGAALLRFFLIVFIVPVRLLVAPILQKGIFFFLIDQSTIHLLERCMFVVLMIDWFRRLHPLTVLRNVWLRQ
jgi:hypothetical protein